VYLAFATHEVVVGRLRPCRDVPLQPDDCRSSAAMSPSVAVSIAISM
jgi:hypothetical protein